MNFIKTNFSQKEETRDYSKILVSGNLKEFNSKIPLDSKSRKTYFKQLKNNKIQAKKEFKNKKKIYSNEKTSFFYKTKINFLKKRIAIHTPNIDLGYDSQYIVEKSKLSLDYIENRKSLKKTYFVEIKECFKKYLASRSLKDDIKKSKVAISNEKQKLKANYIKELNHIKHLKSNKVISNNAAKEDKQKNKIIYKGDKRIAKLKGFKEQKRENLFYAFFKMRKDLMKFKKIYKSKMTFLSNSIPSDYRFHKIRYLTFILELIFPGLGSLLNKDYYKAFVLFIGTIVVYGLTICFAGGIFKININGEYHGDGILGLITLGSHSQSFQPDSRYYLVFGVISLIFLFIATIYSVIFARGAFKKSTAIYLGHRGYGRLQLQNYLQSNGYPYMIATPIYLVILFTSVFPLLTSIIIVFTNYGDPGHIAPVNLVTWVGFDNLKEVFNFSGQEGKYFLKTLSWSFIWGIGATLTAMVAGVGLALLVNHPRIKGKKYIRVLFLLPIAIPFFIMVLYFKIFFGPTGTMNHDVMPSFMPWKEMTNFEIAPGVFQEFTDYPWFSEVVRVKTLLFLVNIWFGFAGMFLFITWVWHFLEAKSNISLYL